MSNLFSAAGCNLLLFISVLSLFVCCSQIVPAQGQSRRSNDMMRQAEDSTMYQQMVRVSQWVNMYCMLNHRFPEEGDEMKEAKEQINQLVPNPPYQREAIRLAAGLDADPAYADPDSAPTDTMPDSDTGTDLLNRINLVFDPSLTELEIENWRTDPPLEWQAVPGTITAISNNQNLFVLWGAGANGLPLRDQYSKRVIMIIGRYRMLFDTQE